MNTIFQLIVLLFSVIIHEVSHGMMALFLGDDTAEKAGRLSLNPLVHLDPFGSVILPLLLYVTHSPFLFGWAKPVPFNPLNLRHPHRDTALVAIAGPLANISLAVVFGLLIRIFQGGAFSYLLPYLSVIVLINLVLAVFNLIPIPPLDGSKILFYFFPSAKLEFFLNRYSFILILLVLFVGENAIWSIVSWLFRILTGLPMSF